METNERAALCAAYCEDAEQPTLFHSLQGEYTPVSPREYLEMLQQLASSVHAIAADTKAVYSLDTAMSAAGVVIASYISDTCTFECMPKLVHALDTLNPDDTIVLATSVLSDCAWLQTLVSQHPERFVLASLINNLSPDYEQMLTDNGVRLVYQLRAATGVLYPGTGTASKHVLSPFYNYILTNKSTWAHTAGAAMAKSPVLTARQYAFLCLHLADTAAGWIYTNLKPKSRVLVLSEGNCTYAGLLVGRVLESGNQKHTVHYQALVSERLALHSPIRNGYEVKPWRRQRDSRYVYNLGQYDVAVIVTRTGVANESTVRSLLGVCMRHRCREVYFVNGKEISYVRLFQAK